MIYAETKRGGMKRGMILNEEWSNSFTRKPTVFVIDSKEVHLSAQGSPYHHCEPEEILYSLLDYESLEVALYNDSYEWIRPEELGFKGLEIYWGSDDVGSYVPLNKVLELADYLASKQRERGGR